ncbi:MAG: Nicotinate phosphoribosyltransferase pncB2 [Verrucomicrobiota bacterium]|jgi:nicotinate phosphoribosyltransferase
MSPLLTDLYQLTMAYGYWKNGTAEDEAVFHGFFRKLPFGGGFAVAAGLGPILEWLRDWSFSAEDRDYLAGLTGRDGKPLFEKGFLDYLGKLRLSVDIDAIPEGTLAFPHEPLIRVRGPVLQGQLLETAILNLMNFNTLIATKAARVCLAAGGDPVLEFGLRRAQGADGAMAASRAAFLGGCAATSNVLAGQHFGIPVKGTHAHSWVMGFDSELEAFRAYAAAMPNNCVFLVDTYDTLQGVRNAVTVGRELRQQGHEMVGIRLDSGDLAWLSIEARKILDEGGFPQAKIVASNDLDEKLIESLKHQGAKIDLWGIGTKLVTAYDQPALGGVYKLGAIRQNGVWTPRIKLSEQRIKVSNPGIQQVRRFSKDGLFVADAIYDSELGLASPCRIIDPLDPDRCRKLEGLDSEDLLVPVLRRGQSVYQLPSLRDSRSHCLAQLARLSPESKRIDNPHTYPVGLESHLHERKESLIRKARNF